VAYDRRLIVLLCQDRGDEPHESVAIREDAADIRRPLLRLDGEGLVADTTSTSPKVPPQTSDTTAGTGHYSKTLPAPIREFLTDVSGKQP